MKARKALSGLVFGVGCASAFVGFLALLTPRVNNAQLQLLVASIEKDTSAGVAGLLNAVLRYVMHNSWYVIGFGALCMLLGGLLFSRFDRIGEPAPVKRPVPPPYVPPREQPAAEPESNPFAVASTMNFSTEEAPAAPSFPTYVRPILEPNRIEPESWESYELPVEPLPPVPHSFEAEAQAVRSEMAAPSPSGSRMILRTLLDVPPEPEAAPFFLPEEPVAAPFVPAEEPAAVPVSQPEPLESIYTPNEEPAIPLSPRIRSTMGRHTV